MEKLVKNVIPNSFIKVITTILFLFISKFSYSQSQEEVVKLISKVLAGNVIVDDSIKYHSGYIILFSSPEKERIELVFSDDFEVIIRGNSKVDIINEFHRLLERSNIFFSRNCIYVCPILWDKDYLESSLAVNTPHLIQKMIPTLDFFESECLIILPLFHVKNFGKVR